MGIDSPAKAIAERLSFLDVLLGKKKKKELNLRTTEEPPVQDENNGHTEYETVFSHSKSLLTMLLLRTPVTPEYMKMSPRVKKDLEDAVVMALIVFLQIIYTVNDSNLRDWDHSSLQSRIALAISAGLAVKYLMDDQPFESVFLLTWIVKQSEVKLTTSQFTNYVCAYESIIVKRVNLYRCAFNHRVWATSFLDKLNEEHEMSLFTSNRVYDVVYFVCFNTCEMLPDYEDCDETTLSQAIVVLSIQCTSHACRVGQLTKSRTVCDYKSYELAAKIGHALADKKVCETQDLLGSPFVDKDEWQYRATQPCVIRRSAFDMERNKHLSAISNWK